MSKKSYKFNGQRNARLAWLSQEIGKGQSDAQIILGLMTAFKCSEKIARQDLKDLYERFEEINEENIPLAKAKYREIGFQLLKQCQDLCQMGPAVNQFKTLAQMDGVLTERPVDQSPASTAPAPSANVVRERIEELYKRRKVTDAAKEANIDLKDLYDKTQS